MNHYFHTDRAMVLPMHLLFTLIIHPQLSGPPSCLCSKTEQCEISGDNEIDFVPDIKKVPRYNIM